ncbi:MAG: Ig-like domain-containing protein, partial [Schleiferiaceae bacterium]|nr:Ig-like domain-containing protein [Schleiferiaceae bacterium]
MKQKFLLFFVAIALALSCARPGAPTGGPTDETPPELVTATPPNKSLYFEGRKIALTFDEYIQLKDLSGQLLISPPLKEKPETLLKGKTLFITLKEDLKDSTTYTFSFGKAITDLNEGNEALGLKYVISTGSYLDSLSFSGKLVDAFTNQPVEKIMALLYDLNDTIPTDSLPYLAFPSYFAITDEQGAFTFENLRLDTFKLFAVEDKNSDYLYNPGSEKMAFVTDLIYTDTVVPMTLRLFKEQPLPKFFNAQYKGYGRIDFNFNQKIDSLLVLQWFEEADSTFDIGNRLVGDDSKDTLTYWFVPPVGGVEFQFLVYVDTFAADTVGVFIRES